MLTPERSMMSYPKSNKFKHNTKGQRSFAKGRELMSQNICLGIFLSSSEPRGGATGDGFK